jgi:hypothetical protein
MDVRRNCFDGKPFYIRRFALQNSAPSPGQKFFSNAPGSYSPHCSTASHLLSVLSPKDVYEKNSLNTTLPVDIFAAISDVPDQVPLLAFGVTPAREAGSAGGMPKVPKGQGLAASAR